MASTASRPATASRSNTKLQVAAYVALLVVAAAFTVMFTLELLMVIDGETVTGTVASDIELRGDSSTGYHRVADVQFTTEAGETHTVRVNVGEGHVAGDSVPVRYIPTFPRSAGWAWLDDSPGSLALTLHGLLGPFFLLVVLVPIGVRSARRRPADTRA